MTISPSIPDDLALLIFNFRIRPKSRVRFLENQDHTTSSRNLSTTYPITFDNLFNIQTHTSARSLGLFCKQEITKHADDAPILALISLDLVLPNALNDLHPPVPLSLSLTRPP